MTTFENHSMPETTRAQNVSLNNPLKLSAHHLPTLIESSGNKIQSKKIFIFIVIPYLAQELEKISDMNVRLTVMFCVLIHVSKTVKKKY